MYDTPPRKPYSIHAIAVADGKAAMILGPVELDFLKTGIELCVSCASHSELMADGGNATGKIFVFDVEGDDLGVHTAPVVDIDVPAEEAYFVFHYVNAFVTEEVVGHERSEVAEKGEKEEQGGEGKVEGEGEGGDGAADLSARAASNTSSVMTVLSCAYDTMDGVLGDSLTLNFN